MSGERQELQLRGLDVDAHLEVEDGRLADVLRSLLADLAPVARPTSGAPTLRIVVSGTRGWRVRGDGVDEVASTGEGALTQALAALNNGIIARTGFLAMHAGVVARGDRLLVVPGRSGHGKSTLVAGLLRCGWDYVSDEALALTWAEGQVVGYPRPLALSDWSAQALDTTGHEGADGEVFVTANALGSHVADVTTAKVTDVLLTERTATGLPTLETVRRPDALAALFACGFTHHRQPALALRVVAGMLREAEVWRLQHSDPLVAARLVTDRIS